MAAYLEYARMQQFGAFANKTVGPFARGLNVVYGSNEAGKTTFASFVEGVLFGWPDARGARNTYKPETGERAGWLQFTQEGESEKLSRVKNAEGLQGNTSLIADIDRETYRTMFWLTSDELRSLRNTTDVTARLLTAGSGTTSSPALALENVRGQLAACTSRAASESESVVNLSAELENARTAMVRAQEHEDMLLDESKELAGIEPQRAALSQKIDALSAEIEQLAVVQAKIERLEGQVSDEEERLEGLRNAEALASQADFSLQNGAQADEALQDLGALSASEERKIHNALNRLASQEAKHEHAVELARENFLNSKAAYEALVEAQETADEARRRRQRSVQTVLAVAVPLVFLLAGVPVFVHGRQIGSLSFTALGAGLVAVAVLIACGSMVMLLRPDKRAEEALSRRKDLQWVMLQDQKKLQGCQQAATEFSGQVQSQLENLGLHAAGASISQARSLLDQAKDLRANNLALQQRKQAALSRRSELETTLAQHKEDLAGQYRLAKLPTHVPQNITQVNKIYQQKVQQRQDLRETCDGLSKRCGELQQKLEAARGSHTFDAAKLHYHEVNTRLEESKLNYVRLLLARRMLEQAIAAWESKSQPEVYKQASRLLCAITDGAWVKVQMTNSGQLEVVNSVQEARSPMHLSLGTCQQLYLALRIALLIAAGNVGANVPVLADDILVNFDNKRRVGAARALAELAQHRQVIMLTCHEEIVETMRLVAPSANEVRL